MPRLFFALLLAGLATGAAAAPPLVEEDDPYALPPWVESDYTLPPFPQDENLAEFDVDGATNIRAYVDKTAIGTGTPDEVVRYVMVIRTSGGATNISYEGIRCATNEYRIYATGTQEKTWAMTRNSEWRKFKIHNRPQRSLASYYFCPNFNPIRTPREGLDALRRGIHPAAAHRTII